MKKYYELYLKGSFLPKWISLSAAYSYFIAIINIDRMTSDEYASAGIVDITSPEEKYVVPDAEELFNLENDHVVKKKYLLDIDRALLSRLAKGAITCQGRKSVTRRVVKHANSHLYEDSETVDQSVIEADYVSIDRAFWEKDSFWVNYRDASVLIWEEDPENVHELEGFKGDGFLVTGLKQGDFFVWQEKWVDLQVNASELLKSTKKIFKEFLEREGQKVEPSTNDVLQVSGKNRFFYSKTANSWVVEFNGSPFLINAKPNAAGPLTIQHLLVTGGLVGDQILQKCGFVALDHIGSPPDLLEIAISSSSKKNKYNDYGDLAIIDDDFFMENIDTRSYSEIIGRKALLKDQGVEAETDFEKERIEFEISELRKHLRDNFYEGKPKNKSNIAHIRKRVWKRISDFKELLKREGHEKFRDHLDCEIKNLGNAYVYQCNISWETHGK